MVYNGSSHSQTHSDESSMDYMVPIFRSMRVRSTLFEDLFLSLSQPYKRTDVALRISYGPVIKVHKFALCLSEVMQRRINEAEEGPRRMYDHQHLRIDLPETLRLGPTVQALFLLYLGETVYFPEESVQNALTWFGISKVIREPFENQEFYADYKSQQMRKFKRFAVPYTVHGREFLMDVEGNSRSTRSCHSRNPSQIRLFCSECGTVFTTNEEIDAHDVDPTCPPNRSLKLVSKTNPALECSECGNLFARLFKRSGTSSRLSGASSIPGSARRIYYESIGETLCQRCLPVAAAPSAENHDVGCANNSVGKGLVLDMRVDKCKIENCGMMFVEAPTITEGIYHHTGIAHGLKRHQAYTFRPHPICIVCGLIKGSTNHMMESVGDFLLNVFQCYQAKKKKMNRKPPLARKLPEVSIERDLDTSIWYNRLNIHREGAGAKNKKEDTIPENHVPRPSRQAQQPASQEYLRKRGESRHGPRTEAKESKTTGITKNNVPKTVGKKGSASSGKKKLSKKP
ncbi:unnamed protein product [Allacma fusca]|uniref:Uncharacterized protein n=1 Tax=Allacma fusca TaxID=39272 RepID=A0A8J2JBZ1_9HEXA|nr:unnamed protein product [Allacma fusca]